MMKALVSFFISISIYANVPYIPISETLKKSGSEIMISSDYFLTSRLIDSEGESFDLADGANHSRIDFGFLGKYAFTDHLEWGVGVTGRHVQTASIIDDEELIFSKSGLTYFSAGFKYSFLRDESIQYGLEASFSNALFTNETYTRGKPTDVSLGDDSRSIEVGANFSYLTKSQNFITGRFLYRDPSQDLSSEVYSNFQLALVWQSLALVAGLENVYSLGGDAYADTPSEKPRIYSGTTNLYNSINRSWNKPYLGMNIKLGSHWRLEGKYYQVISGNSTDLGQGIILSLARRTSVDNSYQLKDAAFKQYRIEGEVMKVSASKRAVVVDLGINEGLRKGMKVDFYHFDYLGGNIFLATGFVIKTSSGKSMVKITKKFNKRKIESGTLVKAGLLSD